MINLNTAALRLGMCEKETPGREVEITFLGDKTIDSVDLDLLLGKPL